MPGNPKECLEHARACLRLAAESRRESDKEHFEQLAERWKALARDLEFTQELLANWGDAELDAAPKALGGTDDDVPSAQ
jgi:hypothetical protein